LNNKDKQIEEIKEWFGWDDIEIDIIKSHRALTAFYHVMVEERDNKNNKEIKDVKQVSDNR